jgi:hypothetical protein
MAEDEPMRLLYPKPTTFSDPFQDWMGCGETLQGVLAKTDAVLEWSDYIVIFGNPAPAADYEEGAHYLASVFDYMRRKQSPVESHLCEGLFGFIDHHQKRLAEDGLLSECLDEIVRLFQSYTDTFELIRLTDAELTQYGIAVGYRELPRYASVVQELVEFLIEYALYSAVLDGLMDWLNQGDLPRSCWWLELTDYVHQNWYVTYEESDATNARKQHLIDRLFNLRDYSRHRTISAEFLSEWKYRQYLQRVGHLF